MNDERYVMLIEYIGQNDRPAVMHTGTSLVTATFENRHLLEHIAIELMNDGLITQYQLARIESRVVSSGDLPLFDQNLSGTSGPRV